MIFIPEFDGARIDLEKKVKIKLMTVEFSKSRFKTYFGNIGEMIASEILLKEGLTLLLKRVLELEKKLGEGIDNA